MYIRQLKSHDKGVHEIILEIDELMNSLYPEEFNVLLPIDSLDAPDVYFVGIYLNESLVACGAAMSKSHDVIYHELKRVYVKPTYRGKSLSTQIIKHLISYSLEQSYSCIRLETGNKQIAAIGLYKSLGFKERNIFGDYNNDPEALYMELNYPITA